MSHTAPRSTPVHEVSSPYNVGFLLPKIVKNIIHRRNMLTLIQVHACPTRRHTKQSRKFFAWTGVMRAISTKNYGWVGVGQRSTPDFKRKNHGLFGLLGLRGNKGEIDLILSGASSPIGTPASLGKVQGTNVGLGRPISNKHVPLALRAPERTPAAEGAASKAGQGKARQARRAR